MCTVTIVPLGGAVPEVGRSTAESAARVRTIRMACNRDELRCRPAALGPLVRQFGKRQAIMPVDPVSDGTWIAINDAGLAATLLNVNLSRADGEMEGSRTLSRGTLIPRLMGCSTLSEAQALNEAIDPQRYPPFRLVLMDDRQIAEFYSDGKTMRHKQEKVGDRPHLLTSSGLGDALVEGPRRELFEQLFTQDGDWKTVQEAFHRHSWPNRKHLSVCMERDDARTVSHTIIDIEPQRVVLTYFPDAPDRTGALAPISLVRTGLHA